MEGEMGDREMGECGVGGGEGGEEGGKEKNC